MYHADDRSGLVPFQGCFGHALYPAKFSLLVWSQVHSAMALLAFTTFGNPDGDYPT